MDRVKQRRKLISGFSREPLPRADGKPLLVPPHALTAQDIEILSLFARYRLLSADYIAPLVGTSYRYACHRLKVLKSDGNRYIKLCDTQNEHRKAHTNLPHYLELDDAGVTELHERGILLPARKPVKNLRHQVMADQIMASVELGAIGDIELIRRADILAHPNMPEATRRLAVPDRIPLGKDHYVRPDGEMFVLKAPSGFLFFPGIEADTGTEPIHSYDYERSSINGKFDDYIAIIEREIYKTHFGARTFFVPFITSTARRLDSIMALLEHKTKNKPSLRKHFLFKTHPLFTSSTKPRPTGHMITEEWKRVGASPLDLTV